MAQTNTIELSGRGNVAGSLTPVSLPGDANWQTLAVFQCIGRSGRLGVHGKVVAQPLTAMRLIRAMRLGGSDAMIAGTDTGAAQVVAQDADFAALNGTAEIQSVIPSTPQTTPAGGCFQMVLNMSGVGEWALQVKTGVAGGSVNLDYCAD
jgi:hypothetical protein